MEQIKHLKIFFFFFKVGEVIALRLVVTINSNPGVEMCGKHQKNQQNQG